MKSQQRFPFEYESVEDDGAITAYGGLPVVAEILRSLGISEAAAGHLKLRKRQCEHDEAWLLESFVMLLAAGGECLDDMDVLGGDTALCRLVGRDFPSPETARRFLYAFHDEALIEQAKQEATRTNQSSYIPEESAALVGLGGLQTQLVRAVAARGSCKRATIDVDATIQESNKREATSHYNGGRGYQPVAAYWVEQDLVVADEFRDGQVPAGKQTLSVVERAFAALPDTVTTRRLRADSALYNTKTLRWLAEQGIEFTVSADMSRQLREKCSTVSEPNWAPLEERVGEVVHVAEVEHLPNKWPQRLPQLRYIAIRFTPTQGKLFEEGRGAKYLAVVTNRQGSAADLLKWHWEKAGTIEKLHDVTKNELGGGVLPCGRFGANAAWYRLVMLTYNALSALKSLALPPALHDARPKRLRFHLFVQPVELISHARRLMARVRLRVNHLAELLSVRRGVWLLHPSPG